MPITFTSNSVSFRWKDKNAWSSWIRHFVSRETGLVSPRMTLNFIALDMDSFRSIHDEYIVTPEDTDIITFHYGPLIADVFLCVPVITANSIERSIPFKMELARVMIHGVLHLMGYNDKTQTQKRAIRAAEHRALKLQAN